jgi:hypothetical protein
VEIRSIYVQLKEKVSNKHGNGVWIHGDRATCTPLFLKIKIILIIFKALKKD